MFKAATIEQKLVYLVLSIFFYVYRKCSACNQQKKISFEFFFDFEHLRRELFTQPGSACMEKDQHSPCCLKIYTHLIPSMNGWIEWWID